MLGTLLPRVKVRAGFYRVGALCVHKGHRWCVYHHDKLLPSGRFRSLEEAHWWASDNQPKQEAPMAKQLDTAYIAEILSAARKQAPMTLEQFALFTQLDVNGGYAAEVDEATKRYFSRK